MKDLPPRRPFLSRLGGINDADMADRFNNRRQFSGRPYLPNYKEMTDTPRRASKAPNAPFDPEEVRDIQPTFYFSKKELDDRPEPLLRELYGPADNDNFFVTENVLRPASSANVGNAQFAQGGIVTADDPRKLYITDQDGSVYSYDTKEAAIVKIEKARDIEAEGDKALKIRERLTQATAPKRQPTPFDYGVPCQVCGAIGTMFLILFDTMKVSQLAPIVRTSAYGYIERVEQRGCDYTAEVRLFPVCKEHADDRFGTSAVCMTLDMLKKFRGQQDDEPPRIILPPGERAINLKD